MSRTVFLHVGLAKTGTTYLQQTLFASRRRLARRGTLYPGALPASHFFGSLDVRGVAFKGYQDDRVPGAWDRLVAETDAYDGHALISHETIAQSRTPVIQRIVRSFATDDVRVVFTCRDLFRQLPAVWQENLKNGDTRTFTEYAELVFATWPVRSRKGPGFWASQDAGVLVRRWADEVGPDRVTLVTVPPRGSAPGELWRRFAQASELPDIRYSRPSEDTNASLGVAEAELLRRLNPRLSETMDWPAYDRFIKRRLSGTVLSEHQGYGRLTLTSDWAARLADITAVTKAALAECGVPVIGDLDDLDGDPEPAGRMPDELTDAEVLDVALDVVGRLATEPPRRKVSDLSVHVLAQRFPPLAAVLTRRGAVRSAVRRRLGRTRELDPRAQVEESATDD